MDTIRVKNLKIPARHGVYDFEKDKDGLFELDIELKLELKKPGHSDRLEDTINYNDLVNNVTEIFTEKDYNLIEAVCEEVCKSLLITFPLDQVIVRIRKPHAPIMASLDTVEIEMVRKREEV